MTRALSAACLLAVISAALADGPTKPAPPESEFAVELSKVQKAARERKEKSLTEFGRRLDAAKTDADREAAQRWAT